ncbi:hypothetical protein [Teredinibacter franksiae]|uniref:hypothetical protein n=1 Tax=Teredinibacter franksiae TaxID=2761453 RepID=UPI001626A876|nr:hypothetical protein [Teredinibacter franksiae]
MSTKEENRIAANEAVSQFEIQSINFGARFIKDSRVRLVYMEKTKAYAQSLTELMNKGELSPKEAAAAANQMRNEIMEWARTKSSDIGRAKARAMKAKGLDLDALCNKYAKKFNGKLFKDLTKGEQDTVFIAIVESSGRANPKVSARAAKLGKAGRALWILSAGIAIYNIASAEDKTRAAGREAAGVGGGFAGGAASGALVGIWAGPVGVAIGVIVGGVLGAILADEVYIEFVGSNKAFVKRFLDPHTSIFSTDESAIANGLFQTFGYEMDKVYAVFQELDYAYTTDADDIALRYIQLVQFSRAITVKTSLKSHKPLRNLLELILEDGWTNQAESKAIFYLKNM